MSRYVAILKHTLTLIESYFNSQKIGRFESSFITSGFNDPQKKTVFYQYLYF